MRRALLAGASDPIHPDLPAALPKVRVTISAQGVRPELC